ncbi:MAG: DUF2946 domain-containing protein [Anaerolineae bacterium]|nr:DUF2946 domain-containing protein [Anaerolineae bacterium]
MRAGAARLLNWIVVATILFGALAPTLGHALPGDPSSDAQPTAVCTSTGLKFVKVDAGDDGSSERPAVVEPADCPFCLLVHFAALPAGAQGFVPSAQPSSAAVVRPAAAPLASGPIRSAQPRAPPVLS